MLSVLAVFLPSFFMTGPARALFVPLSLAVGFSMGASYLLSSSLVPVLSNWMLKSELVKAHQSADERFDRFRERFLSILNRIMKRQTLLLAVYAVIAAAVLGLILPRLSREIFPSSAASQFRLRFDAPDGTRVPVTEEMARRILDLVNREAGQGNIETTLSYVGMQASSYPINTVFLWTSGPHEAVMNIALRPGASISLPDLEDKLRGVLPQQFPGSHFSFDPGDLNWPDLEFWHTFTHRSRRTRTSI